MVFSGPSAVVHDNILGILASLGQKAGLYVDQNKAHVMMYIAITKFIRTTLRVVSLHFDHIF